MSKKLTHRQEVRTMLFTRFRKVCPSAACYLRARARLRGYRLHRHWWITRVSGSINFLTLLARKKMKHGWSVQPRETSAGEITIIWLQLRLPGDRDQRWSKPSYVDCRLCDRFCFFL